MVFLEQIFTAVAKSFDCLVGNVNSNFSPKERLMGLLTIIFVIAIFVVSCCLLHKKAKLGRGMSVTGATGITVGIIIVFCVVCVIIQH